MNLTKKILFSLLLVFSVCLGAGAAYAADKVPTGLDKAFNTNANMPLNATAEQGGGFNTSANFESIIGKIMTMAMELIGVIFLILAVYAGYTWLTAGGNEEAVEKAKKLLKNAIIGIIVVMAAYAISWFVVNAFGSMVFKERNGPNSGLYDPNNPD